MIDVFKEYKLYIPTGYTAEYVATLDKSQLTTGLISVEALYPQSSLVALRVELSSIPTDIATILQSINTTLAANGMRNPSAFLDGNAVMIVYNTGPNDMVAINALSATPTSPMNVLLPIIGIIAFILFLPALSGIVNSVIQLMVMFFMIKMMAGMMKSFGPNPAAEQISAGQDKIIAGAKKYVKLAATKGKPYAEQAAPFAKESYDELKELASRGVDWARKAFNNITKSSEAQYGAGTTDYIGGIV